MMFGFDIKNCIDKISHMPRYVYNEKCNFSDFDY